MKGETMKPNEKHEALSARAYRTTIEIMREPHHVTCHALITLLVTVVDQEAEARGRAQGIREAAKTIKVPTNGAASGSFDSFCTGMRKARECVIALMKDGGE